MAKTVKWDKHGIRTIIKGIGEPIRDIHRFFIILGLKVDQGTQQTFRKLGARDDQPKWRQFSFRTLHPSWKRGGNTIINFQKWNKRPGTDGAKRRRYSAKSRLLQASGHFRKSFRVMSVSNKQMVYGSNFNDGNVTAKDIIQDRPVLFVTGKDRKKWHREFVGFYNRGLKF